MPSKLGPIPFRPDVATGMREWLKAYAERTGLAVNAVINEAMAEYRERREAADREGGAV